MSNRKRKNGIYLMLTDEEKQLFDDKFKLSNASSMRHFILKTVSEKNVFVVDMQPFREMSSLIAKTSVNVNQIAKRVNQTGVIYKNDIEDIKRVLDQQSKMIVEMRTLLNKTIGNKRDI